ncbi:DUF2510 domain-containing protein [Leifsonia xyli]|uniref:DUF2510 domain-containing protein n=1 Tax=Leifsonia xyli TaxID=1575 RepID=UPI003D679422
MSDEGSPAAGWYTDPADAARVRWWNGSRWTEHTRPQPESSSSAVDTGTMPEAAAATLGPRRAARLAEQAAAGTAAASAATPAPATPVYPPIVAYPAAPPAAQVQPYPSSFPAVPPPPAAPFATTPYNPSWTTYKDSNTAAALALGLGILSAGLLLLTGVLGFVPGLPGIGAIIYGILGITRSGRLGSGRARAVWGLVLGAGSMLTAVLIHVVALGALLGPHYDQAALQQEIVTEFSKQVGQTVTASCPVSAPMTAGSTFTCTVRDANGNSGVIDVTVRDASGHISWVLRNQEGGA